MDDKQYRSPVSREALVDHLLLSISRMEESMACFLQAEADHIYAFTGKHGEFPTSPSNKQIVELQQCMERMISSMADKQKILLHMMMQVQDLEVNGDEEEE